MSAYRMQARIGSGDVYRWAKDDDELLGEMERARKDYYSDVDERGNLGVWLAAYNAFYGRDQRGQGVQFGGEQGELSLMAVNQFRSFLRHVNVLVTGSRPSFKSYARTGSYKDRKSAELNDLIIEHDLTRGLEEDWDRGMEIAQVMAEAFLVQTWDPMRGDVYAQVDEPVMGDDGQPVTEEVQGIDPLTGMPTVTQQEVTEPRPVYSGEVQTRVLTPLDVVRDCRREDTKHRWYMVRERVNRWDLAAEYPVHRDRILNYREAENGPREMGRAAWKAAYGMADDDETIVWHLYHERCPTLPAGRYVKACGDVVLLEGGLQYDELPVYPLQPHVEILTAYGHSENWDLLALQQALDSTVSTILTEIDANGSSHWWAPSGYDVDDFRHGVLWTASEKPELVNELRIPEGLLKFIELVLMFYERSTGINEVARGNAEAAKSGAHAALIHSMALQFNSGLQKAYNRWTERVLTGRTRLYQQYASAPRLIQYGGAGLASAVKEFTSQDISSVVSVTVEMDSPLLRTMAGRKELADKWLEAGLITDPTQYMEVVNTGKLTPLTKRPRSQRDLIQLENEYLMEGQVQMVPQLDPMGMPMLDPMTGQPLPPKAQSDKPVKLIPTDDHRMHIEEHSCLLDDPDLRYDDARVSLVAGHIQEHVEFLKTADPAFLEACGQQPLQTVMAQQTAMLAATTGVQAPGVDQSEGGGSGGPARSGGSASSGGAGRANVPPEQQAGRLPMMPTNPQTGERVDPQGATA